MGQITVDPGAATTDERAGPAFAHALAARDFDKLQSLLDPEVEFRALTPRRTWEADGDSPTVDLFRNWFDEATVIEQVQRVDLDAVGDRQHLVYRFSGHDDDAPFVVEQHVYFTERDGRMDWMRMMCSGFRPRAIVPTGDRART
jgi:hypothetical protein